MKRKICTLILTLCILLTLVGEASAKESEALYLQVETVGNEVTVEVYLSPASAGTLTIQFNRHDLRLTDCTVYDPDLSASVTVESVTLLCGDSMPEDTPILRLRFFLKKMLGESMVYTTFVSDNQAMEKQTMIQPPPDPFIDLQYQWAREEILAVYYAGLFKGVSGTAFGPDLDITRAMFVTVLYRMAGSPSVSSGESFTDVPETAYYAAAVAWASENGITNGTGHGCFSPDLSISRQELMTMLYRYAAHMGGDVSARQELEGVSDLADIAPWAMEAVSWAYAERLLNGFPDDTLRPLNTATRAQTAAILCRYEDLL